MSNWTSAECPSRVTAPPASSGERTFSTTSSLDTRAVTSDTAARNFPSSIVSLRLLTMTVSDAGSAMPAATSACSARLDSPL